MARESQAPGYGQQPGAEATAADRRFEPNASVAHRGPGMRSLEESIRRRSNAQLFRDLRIMDEVSPELDHVLENRRRLTLAELRERGAAA